MGEEGVAVSRLPSDSCVLSFRESARAARLRSERRGRLRGSGGGRIVAGGWRETGEPGWSQSRGQLTDRGRQAPLLRAAVTAAA